MKSWLIELRSSIEGDTLVGHAAVFGQYADVRTHLETLSPNAFDRALRERQDVRLTVGHDQNSVLARTKSGTLDLSVDAKGLLVRAQLPDTTLGRDLRTSIARGDLDGMSFAFVPRRDSWSTRDGRQVNTILDLDLHDVSVVGVPAYPGTDVHLRSLDSCDRPGPPARLTRARARLLLLGV